MMSKRNQIVYCLIFVSFFLFSTASFDLKVSSESNIKMIDPNSGLFTFPDIHSIADEELEVYAKSEHNYCSVLEPNYEMIGSYGWEDKEVVDGYAPLNDLKIAVDGDDNIHIFWSGIVSGNYYLFHRMKYNSTGLWGEKETLGTTNSEIRGLMDAETDPDGKIHLTWVQYNGLIRYKIYDYGTWIDRIDNGYGSKPILVFNAEGDAKLLYSTNPTPYSIDFKYSQFVSASQRWMTETIPPISYSWSSQAKNYDIHIIEKDGNDQVFFMVSSIMRHGGYYSSYYTAEYLMLWKENSSTGFVGEGLYRSINLSSNFYNMPRPQIFSTPNGNLHVIYIVPKDGTSANIVYQKRKSTGWTEPNVISRNASINCYLSGYVDDVGRIILLWNHVDYDGTTDAAVYTKIYNSAKNEWTNDALVNPGYAYSQLPAMALDSEGNIHAAWIRQDGTDRILYYRKGWTDSDDDGLFNIDEREIYGTDPYDDDTDDDQMLDGEEIDNGFDPLNPDEDSDGMADGYEFHYGLNWTTDDAYDDLDSDLLLNIEEFWNNTLPNDNDTDNDLVSDYDEVVVYRIDPHNTDTDDDMVPDGIEVHVLGSNANSTDTDNDTMNDYYEWSYGLKILENDTLEDPDNDLLINILEYQHGINPKKADHDDDGLLDGLEVLIWFTNPIVKDTDMDSLKDGKEVYGIYAPTNPGANATGYIFTHPNKYDTDDDFLNDGTESRNDLDPNDNDTDDDLMVDGYEYKYRLNSEKGYIPGLDPLDPSDPDYDYDGDTLTNYEESLLWTNPFSIDTDGDKFTDPEELILGTNPALADTDGDGITDYNELVIFKTNATNVDTDYDDLDDYSEVHIYGSDPLVTDTDGDGILDGIEVHTYGTHPALTDTDGDLIDDNVELVFGSDPTKKDTDYDGMDDYFEWLYNLDPNYDDSHKDEDGDGVVNIEEYIHKANPLVNDTDKDGLTDFQEIFIYYTLPNKADTDADGITDYEEVYIYETFPHDPDTDDDLVLDGEEIALGTDPKNIDSDGDGVSDGKELSDGTDPLDASDNKNLVRLRLILITFGSFLGAILIYYLSPLVITKLSQEEEVKWVRQGILWHQNKSNNLFNNNKTEETDSTDASEETTKNVDNDISNENGS